MERDMDVVRRIALETAKLKYGVFLSRLDDVDDITFAMHAIWMVEAGLIKAHITEYVDNTPFSAHVVRLTWDGCEFADSVKSDTLWRKAKETVIKPTSSFTFGVMRDWLRQEILQGLPTLRGMS
ncbi:hypothetical protein D3C85_995790 [compost metagenome]